MLELIDYAKLLVETCSRVKWGERVLIIASDEAFSIQMGQLVYDVAISVGADAVLTIIKRQQGSSEEPPTAIAAAMNSVQAIICIGPFALGHTDAYTKASAAGIRMISSKGDEGYFKHAITKSDLEMIQERTENVARKLTNAHSARISNALGTDVTMSVEGRKGFGIHPLAQRAVFPDYAEAAISPVEGSANGTIVTDVEVGRWRYRLDKPLKAVVKAGRIVEIAGSEDADKMRKMIETDANSAVFAELGIGTSHTIPKIFQSNRTYGGAALGTSHVGIGRNSDIGGKTRSRVHFDLLVDHPTIEIDGKTIMKDGQLL